MMIILLIMLSKSPYTRPQAADLLARLREPRRFLQIITGARQVGKTTLITQVAGQSGLAHRFASADEPTLRGPEWIAQQWEAARLMADDAGAGGALFLLDEVQKAPNWAETVKRLWDEDTRTGRRLKVVLSGSAQLLIGRGLTESLAGRFELLHLPHWSLPEMRAAFGWSAEQFLFYGAYPGAAPLARQPRPGGPATSATRSSNRRLAVTCCCSPGWTNRRCCAGCSSWAVRTRVRSCPTRRCWDSSRTGNTTTLAHYLDLLAGAGMLAGLQKYTGAAVRRRGSSPKLQVLNTGLMTAGAGLTLAQARTDREFWGRLVETAVGAHLANAAASGTCEVFYWRDRNREVDFVVRAGRAVTAIEVKSGRTRQTLPGMAAFAEGFRPDRGLLVGGDGIAVDEFLSKPVEHWVCP